MLTLKKISSIAIVAAVLIFLSCSDSTSSFDDSLPDEFSLTVVADPEEGGTVEPEDGDFVQGSQVELQAFPAEGYRFQGWEGDIEGEDNPISVAIDGDKQIIAKFEVLQDPEIQLESQPVSSIAGERLDPSPRILVTDETGSPVPDMHIDVSLNKNDFSSESVTFGTTGADGIAEFDELYIETAAQDYVLIFRSDSEVDTLDFPERESELFEVVPDEPVLGSDKVEFPQNGSAGQDVIIAIRLEDQFGNLVSGEEERLAVQIAGTNSTQADVGETSDGNYEAVYTPRRTGVDQIHVEFDGNEFEGNPYTILIFPGSLSQNNSTVQVEPNELKVGNYSDVNIELKDSFGNSLSGLADDVSIINLSHAFADDVIEIDDNGVYRSQVSNKAVEVITISVVVQDVQLSDQPEIVFLVGDPAVFEKRSGDEQQGNVREELPEPFVVRVTDEFLNPIPDLEIEFEITRTPPSLIFSPSLSTEITRTNEDGKASTIMTFGSFPGTYEVRARSQDLGQHLTFRAHATRGPSIN